MWLLSPTYDHRESVHGVVASVGRSDVRAAAGGEVTSALMRTRVAIEMLTKGEGEPIKILLIEFGLYQKINL